MGTHEWDVPITNMIPLAKVSHKLNTWGSDLRSNFGKVVKHIRNLVPFLNCIHQALHLPAINTDLWAEPE